ncbi:hypothetical protein JZU68_09895, partial [bacterium]|nr:hypothetical protein [bacterium]
MAINHKVIGRHFVSKNDFRKAEDHFDLAEKGLVESNDSLELFFIYINMLDLQLRQKQYARAKQFATKSAGCVSQKTDRQALALLYNNLGEIEFLLNNYDSSHY